MLKPIECSCDKPPQVLPIRGYVFGLYVVGCKPCYLLGPARMTQQDAIEQWNQGHRIDFNTGLRVCECCRENSSIDR